MSNDRFRKSQQKKKCAYCHEDIVKGKQSNLQWENQLTHGYCKSAYQKQQAEIRKAEKAKEPPKRYFMRKGVSLGLPYEN